MKLEELWDTYNTKIKNYVRRKVSDEYEAEDIFQEVGFRIIKSESKATVVDNVDAWLFSIARNVIIDYYRSKDRITYFDDMDALDIGEFSSLELGNYNSETASCLLEMAELLPKIYKEAIIESDYNGIQQNLLGEKLGLSYSGAKNRVQRARKKLKENMLDCCEVKADKRGNIVELVNKNNSNSKFSCIKC